MTSTARKLADIQRPTPSDLDIATSIEPLPIAAIAKAAGVQENELAPYGAHAGKVDPTAVLKRLDDQPDGNYIVVSLLFVPGLLEWPRNTAYILACVCSRADITSRRLSLFR